LFASILQRTQRLRDRHGENGEVAENIAKIPELHRMKAQRGQTDSVLNLNLRVKGGKKLKKTVMEEAAEARRVGVSEKLTQSSLDIQMVLFA